MDICIPFKISVSIRFLAPTKCFCENSNGGSTRNAIMCGNEKTIFKIDNCANDEWCAGAQTYGEGINASDYKTLCQKGNIHMIPRQLCQTT